MKIQEASVRKIYITELARLDPITVFLEDIAPRHGKVTITCYNQSWTAGWCGMGDRSVTEFILSCSTGYIAGNLDRNLDSQIADMDNILSWARGKILSDRKDQLISKDEAAELYSDAGDLESIECESTLWDVHGDLLQRIFGDEWFMQLPKTTNPKYEYLCRIVEAVKEALQKVGER